MQFSLLINMLLAFSYLIVEKISCSAELSLKKFYNLEAGCLNSVYHDQTSCSKASDMGLHCLFRRVSMNT